MNLQIGDQPIYNIGPTSPTNADETNNSTTIEKIFGNMTVMNVADNCTKCVEKCGMDCKFTCHSILDCNDTIPVGNLGKMSRQIKNL